MFLEWQQIIQDLLIVYLNELYADDLSKNEKEMTRARGFCAGFRRNNERK
jgi:hypothetical protein